MNGLIIACTTPPHENKINQPSNVKNNYICMVQTSAVCKSDLRSSGTSRSIAWYLAADISGQPVCPIFSTRSLTPDDGTDRLSRNDDNQLRNQFCLSSHQNKDLTNRIILYCAVLTVAHLVGAPRYKPEGRGFDSRWCHWNFSLT